MDELEASHHEALDGYDEHGAYNIRARPWYLGEVPFEAWAIAEQGQAHHDHDLREHGVRGGFRSRRVRGRRGVALRASTATRWRKLLARSWGSDLGAGSSTPASNLVELSPTRSPERLQRAASSREKLGDVVASVRC